MSRSSRNLPDLSLPKPSCLLTFCVLPLLAVVLALANTLLKPVLFVLTLPFTIVTLGLFLLVLNACMLWITGRLVPGLHISGFFTTLVASIVLSLVGMLWKALSKDDTRRKQDRD